MNALKLTFIITHKCFILKVLFLLFIVTAVAGAENKKLSCVEQYARLAFSAAKAGVEKVAEWQKKYWREVRENPLRMLLAPREKKPRFTFMGFLQDPFSEIGNGSKRMSMPLSMALWSQFVDRPFQNHLDKTYTEKVKAVEARDLGAAYLLRLQELGLLTPKEMSDAIIRHKKEMNDWLGSADADLESLPRLKALRALHIFANDEEVQAFNTMAKKIFRDARVKDPESSINSHFAYEVFRRLDDALALPPWSKRSAKEKALLRMFFLPKVFLRGQADLALLAQPNASIDQSMEDLGVPLTLANKLLSQNMTAKEKSARLDRVKRILPQEKWNIAERSDLLGLSEPMDGLRDELDYWQRLQTSLRYQPIRELWLKGRLSDASALVVLREFIQDEQRFKKFQLALVQEQRAPNSAELCSLMGYSMNGKTNALFRESRFIADSLQQNKILSDEQWLVCRLKIARSNWDLLNTGKSDPSSRENTLAQLIEAQCLRPVSANELTQSACR